MTHAAEKPLTVLHLASEVTPFAKSGGLADVASSLPRALASAGVRPMVAMPKYRAIDTKAHALARRLAPIEVTLGRYREQVTIHEGLLPGGRVPVLFIEHPWFDREGIYGDASGEYGDNGLRYALFCRAALEAAHRLDVWPQVVHGHDWQSGLALYMAKRGFVPGRPAPRTVFTVHNLAFTGMFPKAMVEELGLGWDIFTPDGAEFYDQLCFLKAGLAYADRITTVSPGYAAEIQTPDGGHGLDGFLRSRAGHLSGVLNGINTDEWDPATDRFLPVHYAAGDASGKTACKAALQRELGLPMRAAIPIVASVSRLTDQKGFDLVVGAAEDLARMDAQFIFLGTGDPRFEHGLRELARRHPGKVAVRIAHEEAIAHRVQAGADMFLMPSRYEPCGLTQMVAMRYGTVPIVRATGGLNDTVVDFDERTRTGSGFKFDDLTPMALASCVKRALGAYKHRDAWADLVTRVMALDFGWVGSARRYAEIYRDVVKQAQA